MLIMLFFIVVGCGPAINEEDLQQLNGYWQIAEVAFADGNTKQYPKLSTTVDYIEWDGSQGFRKKVQPKLNGTYTTSDDAEPFKIRETDGTFSMHYKNELSAWQETLVKLKANTFSVVNESQVTYTYIRFEPIDLQP